MPDKIIIEKLIDEAFAAREKAYIPYSSYAVGAAVYTEDGCMYSGCNIENASYGATNCAERTAIFKAVSEGHRHIKAIAIVGGMKDGKIDYTSPCGICRQVIAEFGNEETSIIMPISNSEYKIMTLAELLPSAFKINYDREIKNE